MIWSRRVQINVLASSLSVKSVFVILTCLHRRTTNWFTRTSLIFAKKNHLNRLTRAKKISTKKCRSFVSGKSKICSEFKTAISSLDRTFEKKKIFSSNRILLWKGTLQSKSRNRDEITQRNYGALSINRKIFAKRRNGNFDEKFCWSCNSRCNKFIEIDKKNAKRIFFLSSSSECANFLKELDQKLIWPSVKVFQAIVRANPTCAALIWSKVLPLLIGQFENLNEVFFNAKKNVFRFEFSFLSKLNHKKTVFELIVFLLQPTGSFREAKFRFFFAFPENRDFLRRFQEWKPSWNCRMKFQIDFGFSFRLNSTLSRFIV